MRCMRFEWKRFSIQVPILVPGSIRTESALKAHKKIPGLIPSIKSLLQ